MKELNRYQNIAMERSTSENPLIHSRLFSDKITKRLTFRVFLCFYCELVSKCFIKQETVGIDFIFNNT